MDNKLKKLLKVANIPGLSLSIIKHNKIKTLNVGVSNFKTKKRITNKTMFLSASLSKPLFSYYILKLVENNILDLDKPLYKYTKISKINKTIKKDKRYKKITTRMVLSHTSGLGNIGENKILFNPGSKFLYSGDAFMYLQSIVENIIDKSLNEHINEIVFRPFKMRNSSFIYKSEFKNRFISQHDYNYNIHNFQFKVSELNSPYVAGGLMTNTNDYSKFLIGLSNDTYIWKQMIKSQSVVNTKTKWGLGVGLDKNILWHWGDNLYFRNFMMFNPKTKSGFVLFTNSENGLSILDELTKLLYKKKFNSVLSLKDLTEGRYLHEQYNNKLRIERYKVFDEFMKNGINSGLIKFIEWKNNLSNKNLDQIDVLIERFAIYMYKKNKKYVNAIIKSI